MSLCETVLYYSEITICIHIYNTDNYFPKLLMEFFFGESLAELCEECSDYVIIIKEEEEERKFTSMVKGRWGKLEGCVKEG